MSDPWPTLPLGDLCKMINGRPFKPSDWGTEGLPIVRIQNLNDHSKPFNYYSGRVAPNHLIDTGDILLSWSGTPGTSFGCFRWERGPAALNQHIFKVLVDASQMDGDFFIHAVNGRLEEMISHAHGGVGLRHITKGKLESIRLPLPSLDEQSRIVARIQECIERVEEIENLRNHSIEEAKATLPSLLSGTFDALASTCKLVEIGEVSLETRFGTSHKCSSQPKGMRILRIPNVIDGLVNFENLKYCSLDLEESRRVRLRNGDLLFVRTNGSRELVGRCAIFEVNDESQIFGFASYLIRVRLDQARISPHFLAFFLNSTHGRMELNERRRTSAGQFNINSENLRSIKLPLPPLNVQEELVETFRDQSQRLSTFVDEMEQTQVEEAFLRDSILRKAFAENCDIYGRRC